MSSAVYGLPDEDIGLGQAMHVQRPEGIAARLVALVGKGIRR